MSQLADPVLTSKCAQATCRSCGRRGLRLLLDLGLMPLSDGLLRADELQQPEARYPLELAFCPECALVQILETVDPAILFTGDYPYYSSFSDSLLEHSRTNALELMQRRGLDQDSFVIELASNDGYLLKNFVEKGIPVLGIDPAPGPAAAAEQAGVPTLCAFCTRELAQQLRAEGIAADLIIANNVLAHVADTGGFIDAIAILLKDAGMAVIEAPYVRDLIDKCEFDTIYHEHLCYFSVSSLDQLFRRHGLYLNDIRRLSIHGGSLRLYVSKDDKVQPAVTQLLDEEVELGVDCYDYYHTFGQKVQAIRQTLRQLLLDLKSKGGTLAAYGAPAKGTILLNYLGIGSDIISFAVDRNTHKQGKYIPGVRIPIRAPEALLSQRPDYTLLLPWNLQQEILSQQQPYRDAGGRFIIPIPQPAIA